MRHYIIRQASDPKVIGVKNGGSQAKIDRDGFDHQSNYDNFIEYFLSKDPETYWRHLGTIPDFEINLDCVRLEPQAKITDFISYYPNLHHGAKFLVSKHALEIIKAHNLPLHKIYNVKIYAGKEILPNYKLLYCPPLPYNVIDFDKTLFFTGNRVRGKKIFSLASGAEFEKAKDDRLFQVDKIVLNNAFDGSLDYFLTKVSIPDIFVSSRLRDAITKEGLTGLNIIESIDPTIEVR
jgi:hypothetical protein